MSGKRPGSTPATQGGPRQYKQTKLNFFSTAASKSKTPEPTEEEPDQVTVETKDQVTDAAQPTSSTTTPKPTTTITTNPNPTPTLSTPARIRITHHTGDIFAAPRSTLLIHACNTIGSWGGGIALAFHAAYPAAYQIYRAHCLRSTPNQLIGTALLIPPVPSAQGREKERGHYIGCLFTSRRYGKTRDTPEEILEATGPAVRALMGMVARLEREGRGEVAAVRMCRINSGLFAVPWEESQRVVEEEVLLGEGEVPACARGGVVGVEVWER